MGREDEVGPGFVCKMRKERLLKQGLSINNLAICGGPGPNILKTSSDKCVSMSPFKCDMPVL